MKVLAFLDVETDSLDPVTGHLLEVACVLWSVPLRSTIAARSWLVMPHLVAADWKNAARSTNGIGEEMLFAHADPRVVVEAELMAMSGSVDALIAWNADFDSRWLPPSIIPWICAMDDLTYPRGGTGKSCTAVALAHGVGVVDAHRAMTDCMTMVRLFERVAEILDAVGRDPGLPGEVPCGPFEQWLARGLRPKAVYVNADRSYNPKANDLYKAHGFRWHVSQPSRDLPEGEKVWWRKMAVEDAKALPFRVEARS